MSTSTSLEKSLGQISIWGLGVGYVISGMYFGWNLGLPLSGSCGFFIATALMSLFYVCFVSSYTELSCMMPKAGGAFVYVERAFGERLGLVAGLVQYIEFVLAIPAIAAAIGAYFALFYPSSSPITTAIVVYGVFTLLNMYGVKHSARFELGITIFAVVEILIFAGITLPHFSWAKFTKDAFVGGGYGIWASIPYAIWFYLGIEGIANIAEEAKNPSKDIRRGFGLAILTLVILATLVLFAAVGVDGWRSIVFVNGTETTSDSPLPLAMAKVVGTNSIFYHVLVSIGLFGLVASFHGLTLAGSRAAFELGRARFLPAIIGTTHETRHTPVWALVLNLFLGICALLSGKTSELITLSVLGALSLYFLSLIAFFKLRISEKHLNRPFVAPGFPIPQLIALTLCAIALCAVVINNIKITAVFCALLCVLYVMSYVYKFVIPAHAGMTLES